MCIEFVAVYALLSRVCRRGGCVRNAEVDTEDEASKQGRDEHWHPFVLERPVLKPFVFALLQPDLIEHLKLPFLDRDVAPLVCDTEKAHPGRYWYAEHAYDGRRLCGDEVPPFCVDVLAYILVPLFTLPLKIILSAEVVGLL